MPNQTRIVSPCLDPLSVRTADDAILHPPGDWVLVPPGDPALTRRLKTSGPTWTVQEKKGRKIFSRGVWGPLATVESIRSALAIERAAPQYAQRRQADASRRQAKQVQYVHTFQHVVLDYLAFHPRYAALADQLAQAVTEHATPVGSGTVARTERIPVEQRAEAAVIAWLRHQTTTYEQMAIPRIKGKRREMRRMLAAKSKALLDAYRAGREIDPTACPLQRAMIRTPQPVRADGIRV